MKIFLLLLAISYLLVAKDMSNYKLMGPDSLDRHITKSQILIVLFSFFLLFVVFCTGATAALPFSP